MSSLSPDTASGIAGIELSRASARLRLSPIGARIVDLHFKGPDGDVPLTRPYAVSGGASWAPRSSAGAVVGRWANRLRGGRLEIGGIDYRLARNDGLNTLHGGPGGFHTQQWEIEDVGETDGAAFARFSLTSLDGDQGFPGAMVVRAEYRLLGSCERYDLALELRLEAEADRETACSLGTHAYWNLSSDPDISGHDLRLLTDEFVEIDADGLPTGRLEECRGSPWDTAWGVNLGARLNSFALAPWGGFDHYFMTPYSSLAGQPVGLLSHRATGRTLSIFSDQPGVQVYTANKGKAAGGASLDPTGEPARLGRHEAIAFEAHRVPDAPNLRELISSDGVSLPLDWAVRPGEPYVSTTRFEFREREPETNRDRTT